MIIYEKTLMNQLILIKDIIVYATRVKVILELGELAALLEPFK